jgi:hypothetical protein
VTLLDEVSRGESITVRVTTGKALVGHIEESEVALLFHDIANLAPLVLGGINTGGVVSTGVQQDDAVVGSGLDVSDEALEVKANSVLVVVTVGRDLHSGVLEDGGMVGPAGSGKVDLLSVRVEALQESTSDSQGTGTGNGLSDDKTVLLDDGGVAAIGELRSSLCKGRNTSDTSIFFVETRRNDLVFGSANRGQNIWLALVITYSFRIQKISRCTKQLASVKLLRKPERFKSRIVRTVSTNTKVDLLLEGIGLECLGDTEDSILNHPITLTMTHRATSRTTFPDNRVYYRRTLRDIGPGRGMSSTDDHGAHARLTRSSLAAGDSKSGQHCGVKGANSEI